MSGKKLSYTFFGTDTNPTEGVYTPLIIPGFYSNNTENTTPDLPTTSQPDLQTGSSSETNSSFLNSTPFSKIKNYHLFNISNNNLSSSFSNKADGFVNVLHDYYWTISPKSSKKGKAKFDPNEIADETPYVILKEKYFLVNNLIAQALYSLSSAIDAIPGGAGRTIEKTIDDFFKEVPAAKRSYSPINQNSNNEETSPDGTGVMSNIGTAIDSFGTSLKNLGSDAYNFIKSILNKTNNPDLEKVLFPYNKLYILGETGFQYMFPYLSRNILDHSNNFGAESTINLLGAGALVDTASSIVETAGQLNALATSAGSSKIERTKYYQYPDSGPEISLSIPLYNTPPASYQDICNNYKLIFLLLYQNSPLRQDKIIVEPPVLYDLKIPGGRREPYCYLSSFSINYLGATRFMDIDVSGIGTLGKDIDIGNEGKIKAIIPDAYSLQLTFQPMIATTKNLLFASIQKDVVNYSEI